MAVSAALALVLLLSMAGCEREPAVSEEPAAIQEPVVSREPAVTQKLATTPKPVATPQIIIKKGREGSGGTTVGGRVPCSFLRACCFSYMGQPRGRRGVESASIR